MISIVVIWFSTDMQLLITNLKAVVPGYNSSWIVTILYIIPIANENIV